MKKITLIYLFTIALFSNLNAQNAVNIGDKFPEFKLNPNYVLDLEIKS